MLYPIFLARWSKRLKSNDNYCGFSCGDKLEDIQNIMDEIKDFANYNPETAIVVLDKIIKIVNDTRTELVQNITIKEVVKTGV